MIYDANPPVLPGHTVVGACSICRGPVVAPSMLSGQGAVRMHCVHCGARNQEPERSLAYGPYITMEKPHG